MNSEKTIFPDTIYKGGIPINGKLRSISFLFNKMVLSLSSNAKFNGNAILDYTNDVNKIIEKFDSTLNNHIDEIIDGKEIILLQLQKLSELPVEDLMNDEVKLAQADIYFCTRLGFIKNDEYNGMIASIEFDSDQDLQNYILGKKDGEEIWKNAVHKRSIRNN